MKMKKKKTVSQKIKSKARRTLTRKVTTQKKSYVVDKSAVINKFLPRLLKKGLRGRLIIPNAVMAELENLANKGKSEGFIGLEEITKLHKYKNIKLHFYGLRPNEKEIRFAKSGEIDALIRDIARKTKSILITTDLVQAKSSQAYGVAVIFLKPRVKREKKRFLFWRKSKR